MDKMTYHLLPIFSIFAESPQITMITPSNGTNTTIRIGKKDDLPRVLELVKELATYEKAAHEVINTVVLMEQDGFGKNPSSGFLLLKQMV